MQSASRNSKGQIMNKSTIRELNTIGTYVQMGMIDTAARAASALVRCQLRQSVKQ